MVGWTDKKEIGSEKGRIREMDLEHKEIKEINLGELKNYRGGGWEKRWIIIFCWSWYYFERWIFLLISMVN